jgi:glucuronoarabinoxylan endo-1,4-beta-xylanase
MISIDFQNERYVRHTVTPVGWITAQYARYVRPGDVRVGATSSSRDVSVTAYTGRKRVVLVATNPGRSTVRVQVRVVGGKLRGNVVPVRSSETEALQSLPSVRQVKGVFLAELPARSVSTFVAKR